MNIYVPRVSISLLINNFQLGQMENPCICVRIPYLGYEVSIGMDSSHGPGDLNRSDIWVFEEGRDITDRVRAVVSPEADMLRGDADTLLAVFHCLTNFNSNR